MNPARANVSLSSNFWIPHVRSSYSLLCGQHSSAAHDRINGGFNLSHSRIHTARFTVEGQHRQNCRPFRVFVAAARFVPSLAADGSKQGFRSRITAANKSITLLTFVRRRSRRPLHSHGHWSSFHLSFQWVFSSWRPTLSLRLADDDDCVLMTQSWEERKRTSQPAGQPEGEFSPVAALRRWSFCATRPS